MMKNPARQIRVCWFACALLLMSFAAPVTATPNQALRRYPYLTDLVGSYVTINWATDRSEEYAFVRWGKFGSESCDAHTTAAVRTNIQVNSILQYQWKAQLTLEPDTRYCYRVYLGADPALDLLGSDPTPAFFTQLPVGSTKPFQFAVIGDWGAVDDQGDNPHLSNLLQQMAASGARFALTTGDNANPSGTQANYGDLLQHGAGLSVIFGPAFWAKVGSGLPLFPTMGNHGFTVSGANHPHLLNWPQDRAVELSQGRYQKDHYCCLNGTLPADYPSAWYAFDAGIARFYVLQSAWADLNIGNADPYRNDYDYHWAPSAAQYQWLQADLEQNPRSLKFAFFQYPLYSDTSTEPSDTLLQGPASLEGLLSRYQVQIAFNGHSHTYQRFHKLHSGSLISYVTGGGGDKLKPVGQHGCSVHAAFGIGWSASNGGSACGQASAPQAIEQVYHFLLVTVDNTNVTVTPIDELGRSFDIQHYDFAPIFAYSVYFPQIHTVQ
jgi:hypothetical protein